MPRTSTLPPNEAHLDPQPLKPGPMWGSFEQFRMAGPGGPEAVARGQVGTLRTKAGLFRLLRDEDFQALVGLASEAKRLKGGLATMVHASRVIRDHPSSPSAAELLFHLASEYAGTFTAAETLEPDTSPIPDGDEIIVDPGELKRRVSKS